MATGFTNNKEIVQQAKSGPDKQTLPYLGNEVNIDPGDQDSPVINIKGRRGIGLNFPAMPAVTGFDIYVSPTDTPLGAPGSLMAKHQDIATMVVDGVGRKAFSTAFIAEHFFCQIVANATEVAAYKYQYTLT